MHNLKLAFISAVAALSTSAFALSPVLVPDMATMAKEKNCFACHSVAKRVVGPAFTEVARKYTGQEPALEALTKKIRKGGSGVWGAVAMPANLQVSDEEAKQLAKWVLSQKG